MSLGQSVKKSLMDYQDARIRRRELLGPDALDTLTDISEATIQATHAKVKSVTTNLRDKFNEYRDERVKPFIDNLKSRIADMREAVRDSIQGVTDQVREDVLDAKALAGRSKQSFVERVRGGIGQFRGVMADNLDKVANILRGEEKATKLREAPSEFIDGELVGKKRGQTAQQSAELFDVLPDNVHQLSSPITRLEAVASSQPDKAVKSESTNQQDHSDEVADEVSQRKLRDTEPVPKEVKEVSDEDIALFAQYYYRNHGAARQALEVVDAKEEPTFADYAMAAGLTAFVGEFRSKEAPDLSKVNEKPESLEKVQQAVQDIDQMKLAQERLQALEAERLILRNQVAEIADKYQLDPEELEVGQTETSVKSIEQQFERIKHPDVVAEELEARLQEAFPGKHIQVDVEYKPAEAERTAEAQDYTYDAPVEPYIPDDSYFATLDEPTIDLDEPPIELTEDDLSEFQNDAWAMTP